jgi:hypothetical protein
VIVFLLATASFLAEISEHVFGRENLLGLVSLVKMDAEANLPTWFNSVLLLCCAGLALLIGSIKRQELDRYGWHWLGFSAVLLLLPIDDAGGSTSGSTSCSAIASTPEGCFSFPG